MTIQDRLEAEGYRVGTAGDGDTGFAMATTRPWTVIVLDLMLPGRDGLAVCRDLRAKGVTTPILMLTARDQTVDKVVGLRMGADDYLTKPFEMIELVARIEVLQRRGAPLGDETTEVRIGDWVLDLRRQELRRNGVATSLSTQEFKLLRYLSEHRGEVLDRDELLSAAWGYDESVYSRTVDVHIAWLRQKLDDRASQSLIVTVRGRGYKLAAD
jgi:two-component system alkaline phosphatase synthesis response regulator PhoP